MMPDDNTSSITLSHTQYGSLLTLQFALTGLLRLANENQSLTKDFEHFLGVQTHLTESFTGLMDDIEVNNTDSVKAYYASFR